MEKQAKINELLEKVWVRFVRRDIRNRVDVIGATLTESQVNDVLYRYMEEDWTDDMNYEERIDHLIMQESSLVFA